jgi:RNA polymerase sigma factor (sigma-70 family)
MARDAATDAELLARFVRHADEAAFAELVDRLGPLVYGVCRRLLANRADAEDAFQAAFLVLVRRADSLAGRAVGPWLHRVAVLTARRFRRAARPALPVPEGQTPPATAAVDARLDLDAALAALPEKYRVPVILCHLQGWTRRELAAHLGCPESTASSLVGRGLAKLRKRLAGHDAATVLAVAGAAVVPAGLARAAVRAAIVFRTNSPAAAVSPAVAELTEGVLRMFRVKTWAAGLAVAVVVAAGTGFGLTGGFAPRAEAQPTPPPDDTKAQREKLEKEIAAAKAKLKQLEDEKARLILHDHWLKMVAAAKKAPVEPHIGIWVRPPLGGPVQMMLDRRYNLNTDPNTTAAALAALALANDPFGAGVGRSEFAINEFTKDRPVVEAHFYDLGSLKTYLTRAAKDPAAPKKLKLHIDKDYPAAKVKPLLDACKEAGFATIELAVADGAKTEAPAKAAPQYTIEPPDVLKLAAVVRGQDEATPLADVTGDFLVRPDGTVSLGKFGAVKVAGLTADQAKDAVREHLAAAFVRIGRTVRADALDVSVAVSAANSKRYYVIFSGESRPAMVYTFPYTGKETVRDALRAVTEFIGFDPARSGIEVVRPDESGRTGGQVLPVDWAAQGRGDESSNHNLRPGDRIYVKLKK